MSEPVVTAEMITAGVDAYATETDEECCSEGIHAAIAAIEASGEWVVVPVVPTGAMLTAHKAYCDKIYDGGNAPTAIGAWRAKIAARPKVTP